MELVIPEQRHVLVVHRVLFGGDEDPPSTKPPGPMDNPSSPYDEELLNYVVDVRPRDRVLVVDDDPAILEVLEQIISSEKDKEGRRIYDVEIAEGGKAGLVSILTGKRPDVVLLDWMMPNIHGALVHDLLKQSEEYRDIPILFITAQPSAFRDIGAMQASDRIYLTDPKKEARLAARRAMKSGAPPPRTSMMPKPFNLEDMLGTLRRALDERKGKP